MADRAGFVSAVERSAAAGGRKQRAGHGSLRGLEWLARVGPAPVEAWAVAMAWSLAAAYSHAERLERERWLARYPTLPGEGAMVAATRTGTQMVRVSAAAPRPPAPTWWAHLRGCAWTAAWLTVRGRDIQGPREVAADESWSGEVRWRDSRGQRKERHEPDLAWLVDGRRVAIEVELARKSTPRLDAILALHARWRVSGHTAGVIYVCERPKAEERLVELAASHGLGTEKGGGLRVLVLDTVRDEAKRAAGAARAAAPAGGRVTNGHREEGGDAETDHRGR